MSDPTQDMREVGPLGQAISLAFVFLLLAVTAVAIGWLVSNCRQVAPDSQAVVTRFGALARVTGPGLLMAWPRPIEQVTVIPSAQRQIQFAITRFDGAEMPSDATAVNGFTVDSNPRSNGGFLMTGDTNIVHLQAQLVYQISDPQAYMIAVPHLEPLLERLFIASAITVTAGRGLDTILVARAELAGDTTQAERREQLRADLMNAVNQRLEKLAETGSGLGITVSRVDLVPSIPAGAKDAFDSVLVATQEAARGIATAQTNAQYAGQDAQRARDRVMTDATASAEERVSNAKVATASITSLAKNSQDMSHGMLMSRLYYFRIGPIFSKAGRVEVFDTDGSIHALMPGKDQE